MHFYYQCKISKYEHFHVILHTRIEVFTELEVGIAGADMIASTENSLHDQRNTQSVEQPEVLRYTEVLQIHVKPCNTQ